MRSGAPSHIKVLQDAITDRVWEIYPNNKDKRRLLHLWCTNELKKYIGVRFFDEMPAEITDILLDLIATYQCKWLIVEDLPPLKIEVVQIDWGQYK